MSKVCWSSACLILLTSTALAGSSTKPGEAEAPSTPGPTTDTAPVQEAPVDGRPPSSVDPRAPAVPFVWGPPAPDADRLVFIDAPPTTLLPLYARTDADLRVQDLLYDRLFYGTALT